MLYLAYLTDAEKNMYPVFLGDSDTGYFGADILKTPGLYEEVTAGKYQLLLAELVGYVGNYATRGMFLLIDYSCLPPEGLPDSQDCTEVLSKFIGIPSTAAKMLLQHESVDIRTTIEEGIKCVHAYEALTENSKVFLPAESLRFLPEDVAKNMRSVRRVYTIKSSENQEIVQGNCTATYGIVLPDVEDVHNPESVPSPFDILRVTAPYRREVTPGVFQYNGIYHTPYYKVDPRIAGAVPSHLSFINGYITNDSLGLQQHEKHMYNNLYTMVCADTSKYVAELVTGVFMDTKFGQLINKCIVSRDAETVKEYAALLNSNPPAGVVCDIKFSDIETLMSDVWDRESLSKLISNSITVTMETLYAMVDDVIPSHRIIDTDHLPFILEISDEYAEKFTELMISRSIISRAIFSYLLALCDCAYQVNWGFTGATRAIPRFIKTDTITRMEKIVAAYLTNAVSGATLPELAQVKVLYATQSGSSEDEEDDDDDIEDDDGFFAAFDYYVTAETRVKIENGTLPLDFFSGGAVVGSTSAEVAIVEYWRKVNGENNLHYFLTTAFTSTGTVKVLLESFAKLMRWGDIKPAMLVLDNYPEVKTVFDLNLGYEVKSDAVVDESQLVKTNECTYNFVSFFTARDIIDSTVDTVAGCVLMKDYGEIQKTYLASFVDIGEMVVAGNIDVSQFKTVQELAISGNTVTYEDLRSLRYNFYVSERNIKKGLESNNKPTSFSEIALLATGPVLQSVEYIKSKGNQMVVTLKDRQYQVLTSYVSALRGALSANKNIFAGDTINTTTVLNFAKQVYTAFNQDGAKDTQHVNDVRAGQAIRNLNLDTGTTSSLRYEHDELEGKFILISDLEMVSGLPPIEFTDNAMQQIANKFRNRLVLLLLDLPDKLVICRKDITTSDIRTNKTIKYSALSKMIDAIRQGKSPKVRISSDGESKVAVLHESVMKFIN